MFPFTQTTTVCKPAHAHFMDTVINKTASAKNGLTCLETRFFDNQAKLIYGNMWLDLEFKLVKAK